MRSELFWRRKRESGLVLRVLFVERMKVKPTSFWSIWVLLLLALLCALRRNVAGHLFVVSLSVLFTFEKDKRLAVVRTFQTDQPD